MIKKILEIYAPAHLAMEKDPVGLQIGTLDKSFKKVLVSLDVTEEVVDEAVTLGADLIFCHHAPLYRPIATIHTDTPQGRMIEKLIKNDISVYVAHTNLDIVQGGVNDSLAKAIGLQNLSILQTTQIQKIKKLAVFVPSTHHQQVLDAISSAGAGWIGNYSHCSFNVEGYGTFMPRDGANPYIGTLEKLEKVSEIRIETIFPESMQKQVIEAMLAVHPYEEVAYDIFPLDNEGSTYGIGRVGTYAAPKLLEDFIVDLKTALSLTTVQIAGARREFVFKVAVCGGSGGRLIQQAISVGADIYVTGDITYHDAQYAADNGIMIVNAGHYQTESLIVLQAVKDLQALNEKFQQSIEFIPSKVVTDPFEYM